jgi:hypothetical protein
MSNGDFEPRYRWAIYREMKRLRERHPEATDDNFDLLYEQLRDAVMDKTALDNLAPAKQLQQVVLASRRAVTAMAEMLDSGGSDADGTEQ